MKLYAKGISKKYPRKTKNANFFYAVNSVDFELQNGCITEIIGRSGSGKTTLMNMLAGLLKPSEGSVLLDNDDLYSLDDKSLSRLRNKNFGVIPQGQSGIDSLTVLENVLLPVSLYSGKEQNEKDALSLLERLDILDIADAYPSELSGGEIRRLAIARALIMKPGIIFADEPTGDLDDENTDTVLNLLKEEANRGAAVLMVTHEAEAQQYADYIYKMNSGNLELTTK